MPTEPPETARPETTMSGVARTETSGHGAAVPETSWWGRAASPAVCLLFACLAFAAYLMAGRYPRPGFVWLPSLLSDATSSRILLSIRLPRGLGALLLGAVLGGAGATFQTVFGNPLVEAGFLGVSQGAAFGAALALVAGATLPAAVAGSAFAFAMAALAATLWFARRFRFGGQVLRLVLAGLAVSAFFSSLLAAMKYLADPLSQLPDITFWTMGSLTTMNWPRFLAGLPVAGLAIAAMLAMRWRANLLSLDEDAARALGSRTELERGLIIVAATAGVAVMTALCGIVSWVGLVVPHAARILKGPDGRSSIPFSMLLGGIFVLACDGLSRSLFPGEVPLGILTSLAGACGFAGLLLLRRTELSR